MSAQMRRETNDKRDRRRNSDHEILYRGMAAVAVFTVAFGMYFALRNVVIAERTAFGVVRWTSWKFDRQTGRPYPSMQIMLGDGRLVGVGTLQPELPKPGSQVVVSEKTAITGRRWYAWEGRYVLKREP